MLHYNLGKTHVVLRQEENRKEKCISPEHTLDFYKVLSIIHCFLFSFYFILCCLILDLEKKFLFIFPTSLVIRLVISLRL